MAFNVYSDKDVANGLKMSLLLAIQVSDVQHVTNYQFLRGIICLAQAQAILYGLNWQEIVAFVKSQALYDDEISTILKSVNG